MNSVDDRNYGGNGLEAAGRMIKMGDSKENSPVRK